MEDLTLLWVDARLKKSSGSFFDEVKKTWQWHISESVASAHSMVKRLRPDMIVFDFDYADITGLRMLRQIRLEFPSVPLLMLTEHHYEGLSIWALRCRVWDYMVKPVKLDEFMRQVENSITNVNVKENQLTWLKLLPTNTIPQEAAVIGKTVKGFGAHAAISYIESHLGEKISAQDVSQQCGLSRYELSRAFKSEYGMTFREYLIQLRMRRASDFLRCTDASITDIALCVGFNDLSHFSRVFHRYFGCSPRAYRHENCVTNITGKYELLSGE